MNAIFLFLEFNIYEIVRNNFRAKCQFLLNNVEKELIIDKYFLNF